VNLTIPSQTVYFLLPRTRRYTFSSFNARSSTVHDAYSKTFAATQCPLHPQAHTTHTAPTPRSLLRQHHLFLGQRSTPASQALFHLRLSQPPSAAKSIAKNTLRARPPTIISIRTHIHQPHPHRLGLPSTFKQIDFAFRAETFVAFSTPTIFPTHATVAFFAPCDR
jgi:hypothetical protein